MKPHNFAHGERVPFEPYAALLACYRSGQMSERQWQGHLTDPLFARWLARNG